MFYKLLFSLFIFAFLNHQAYPANEDKINQEEPAVSLNDSILEFFYNCTCIPYYTCSEANRYMAVARANLLPQELTCTDPNFVCCKLVTNTTDTTESSTEPLAITVSEPISDQPETRGVTTKPTTIASSTESASVRNPLANERECGVAQTEIRQRILTPDTDSATTIPGEIPWIVEIFQKQNKLEKPSKLKCAGSLIHPKVIVTATHCVVSNKPESLKIVATGLGHFQNVGLKPQDERNVLKIIKHPQYYSGGLFNDIALLILEKEYSLSKYLNTICIPSLNQNFDGKTCIAAGWGQNPELRNVSLNKVDVPIVDSPQCQNLLRKTSLGPDFNLDDSFLCAGGEKGKDTCKGDGGGPLMCLGDEYKFVLAGIVSWGIDNNCGIVNQPGLYTNVAKFTDWITNELSENGLKIQ